MKKKTIKELNKEILKVANELKKKDAWTRGYQAGLFRASDIVMGED
jgi:hypothetical protein